MALEKLRDIGISEGEIKVYLSLLELGTASVDQIHKKIGKDRRNIYDILNKLIDKGFVTYIVENDKNKFQALPAKRILDYINEKESDLIKTKLEIKNEITSLIKKFEPENSSINASVYKGKEGIKAVFEDMLNYSENFFIGSGGYVAEKMPFFWQQYNKKRIKKGIKWYNLARGELKSKIKLSGKFLYNKFLPLEFSANPVVIFIYGNKVANVLWGKDFFAFVVESKEVAENYKRYHKFLWDKIAKN